MNRSGIGGYLQIAFHPILFGILPVIILHSSNVLETSFDQTIRSWLVTLGIALVLFLALRLCLRDWDRAGLILSVFFFFFYNFRNIVVAFIRVYQGYGFLAFQIAVIITITGMVLILLLQARIKVHARAFTPILNVVAVFLVVFNLFSMGSRFVRACMLGAEKVTQVDPAISNLERSGLPAAEEKPDIYYIILDCYVRADVFKELYGQENTAFLQYLLTKGFYVADQSHSNYSQTVLSVSSSLNMQYLDDLLALNPDADNRLTLKGVLQKSAVPTIIKNQGYQIYSFDSGFDLVNISSSDVMIPSEPLFNSFEQELVVSSLAFLFENDIRLVTYSTQMLNRLDRFEALVDAPGPKFVYAHLLLPHPPFIFGREGNLRGKNALFIDGDKFVGTREDYKTGYAEQTFYTNRRVMQIIDRILAHSQHKSVIILQGDHGSGLNLIHESPEKTCYRERLSILNAYYLPGKGKDALYAEITPVNTFRVILNAYFHADLPLVPDRSYFSPYYKPFMFYEASKERLNQSCEGE